MVRFLDLIREYYVIPTLCTQCGLELWMANLPGPVRWISVPVGLGWAGLGRVLLSIGSLQHADRPP